MFAASAAKQIAAMMVSLGGIDAAIRRTVLGHLIWSGIAVDPKLNDIGNGRIDAASSTARIYVLPSSEQEEIVHIVADLTPEDLR